MSDNSTFLKTGPFWLTVALMVLGGVLLTIARPSSDLTWAAAWMIPVGYGLAVLGAMAMFLLWVRFRAR